jgi:hypothetical protein
VCQLKLRHLHDRLHLSAGKRRRFEK